MSTPTEKIVTNPFSILYDDDDETVVMSNLSILKDSKASDDTTATTANSTDDELSDDESIHNVPIIPCNIALPTKQQAWSTIVHQQHLQALPNAGTIFDPKRLQRTVEYALSDSGATAHFLIEGAPVTNKKVATSPLTITLPDGSKIQSTHTCNLDIPWLPHAMTEAHIVPDLAHSSLISTRKFCDAGCQVAFDENECRVYYKNELVLIGDRDVKSNLWRLPINPVSKPTNNPTILPLDLDIKPT